MPKREPMPAESYFHVFNRGVEKRTIFQDDQDYSNFLDILTYYLTFIKKNILNNILEQDLHALQRIKSANNGIFQDSVSLTCYCLMPNHFHFVLYQTQEDAISNFIRRISTTYAQYFNRKYQRVGSLFQGRFKAKHIDTDEYLLQASKYIHRNPLVTRPGSVNKHFSSLARYTQGVSNHSLEDAINTDNILDYFAQQNPHSDYHQFVSETPIPPEYTPHFTFQTSLTY